MIDEASIEVPTGWNLAKISELFESWGGHTPSKANRNYWGPGIPWISSKEVKGSRLNTSTFTVTQKAIEETGLRVCPVGSVLVVVRSGILAHTLPVAVTEVPVTINQDLKAFYSSEPFLNEWLALFLRMSAHELLASSRRDGTTVQSIQYPLLKNTPIPVPPVGDRRQIIENLDKVLKKQSAVPPRIASAKRAIERFREAVIAAACLGRLTADLREGHELGEEGIPPTWKRSTVTEVCERVSVGHVGPTSQYYTTESEGITFVRSQNVRPGQLVLDDTRFITQSFHDSLPKSQLRAGDVLIVRVGANRGDCCMVPLDYVKPLNCANIVFARPKLIESAFLSLYLQGPGRSLMLRETTGSAQGVINTKAVAAINILVPPLAEQKEIVKRALRMLRFAEELLARISLASRAVEQSPQSILAKAFRGQLVPASTTNLMMSPEDVV